jgi:hypothetical protein
LVKISTDLGLPEREIYEAELKKVNKMKDIQLQVFLFYFLFRLIILKSVLFLQRKASADKSRPTTKGRKISQAEHESKRNLIFIAK